MQVIWGAWDFILGGWGCMGHYLGGLWWVGMSEGEWGWVHCLIMPKLNRVRK